MRLLILLIGFAACPIATAADEAAAPTKNAVLVRDAAAKDAVPAHAGLAATVEGALQRVPHPADPYARWDKVDFDNLHRCAVGCGG